MHDGDHDVKQLIYSSRNSAVVEAIKQYCLHPKSQPFAIMVDGAWGSGKTYLIKSLLSSLTRGDENKKRKKPIYISLFGVTDAAAIDEQIYQQLHPILSNRFARAAGVISRGLMKTALKIDLDELKESLTISSQLPELDLADIVSGAAKRIIFFDDLERAVMPPTQVLAYVNQMVEHEGCRVVVLSNETELCSGKLSGTDEVAAYRRQKEKIIGRTFRVYADAAVALKSMTDEVEDNSVKRFLSDESKFILDIFESSQTENLRLLRQFISDFEQIWFALTADQRSHTTAMREIVGLLYAITLEVRAGTIEVDKTLKYGMVQRMQVQNNSATPDVVKLSKVAQKYPNVDFDSNLLSEGTIRSLISGSIVKADDVQMHLKGHPYFRNSDDEPTWRTLWNSSKLNHQELSVVLHWFYKDFEQRSFQTTGEILHVIGLGLWLSSIGQPNWNKKDIVDKMKSYIDDVCEHADRNSLRDNTNTLDMLAGGAYGYGFYEATNKDFVYLANYLQKAINSSLKRQYPQIAEELKELMISDSEAFLGEVSFANTGSATYASLGVLRNLDPDEFVSILIGLPYKNQSDIAIALSMRYRKASVCQELKDELP